MNDMRNWQGDPKRVKCFFIEPTGDVFIELYRSSGYTSKVKCTDSSYGGGHFAYLPCGTGPERDAQGKQIAAGYLSPEDAGRKYGLEKYPTKCTCGYEFTETDQYGHRRSSIYARKDDPSVRTTLQKAPDGAMYFATWYEDTPSNCGLDGRALIVKAPGGHDWHVDGRASNCTKPDDRVHKCWCRHGDPATGEVTVDKNGNTCSAGAGSLLLKNWHGFLTSGWLHS